ncbi:MAG TPA: hypothetical protein VEU11_01835 [Terriglobales bacterium]|jgi:hypothetical protein|nr:hypothetical protein [Terriglobales bacterium]
MKCRVWNFGCAVLVSALTLGAPLSGAGGQQVSFKIPPVTVPVKIENQPIAITASGAISQVAAGHQRAIFGLPAAIISNHARV